MSLDYRDYMREQPATPASSFTSLVKGLSAFAWVMTAISAVFVAQFFSETLSPVMLEGAVSLRKLAAGQFWTLVTYMFVHGSVGHFLLNMLMLWFVGRQVQNLFGGRHFLQIFFLSGIAGAALEMAVNGFVHGDTITPLVGASASAFGLLMALAVLLPDEQITVFIYFIIPVPMRLWTLAKALVVMQTFFAVAGLLFPAWLPEGLRIAYFAHLGGAFVGWFYARALGYGGRPMTYRSQWQPEPQRRRAPAHVGARARVQMDFEESAASTSAGRRPVEPDLEAEVNDILDKILVEGIGSLTEAEKRLLERASAEIQRRDTTGPLG
ncbi:MAG: rhomboid family intramembrane serine protease [Prosthecobacter sp.]